MRANRVAVAIWLLGLACCAAVIARTPFRTDMGAFLPRSAPMAERVLTAQASDGAASHLLLLAVSGAPAPVLAAVSAALARDLRSQAAFIDVLNGDQNSFAAVQKFVWRNRYLLSPQVNAAEFTTAGLHAMLLNDLTLLNSDAGAVAAQSVPSDPTGEAMALLPVLAPATGPSSQDGVWFSPAGQMALLLVHTQAAGFDLDGQQRALDTVTAAFDAARRQVPGAAAARLQMSGAGIFGIHIRDMTKADVSRLSALATAGAIALLGFAYRSPLVLVLGTLPVASGALAAIAAVSLVFGFVHGVTLGFGVTLIGESLDYAIYLFTQTADGDAARDTLRRIWPTLRLGAATSIAGFAAMLFSDFTGFAQLGLFSIVGLVTAAAVTRFILPQFLPGGFSASAAPMARPVLWLMAGRRWLRWVLLAVLVGAVATLALHRGGFWNQDLNDLSPVPPADAKLAAVLQKDFGFGDVRYFAVAQAASQAQALARSAALAVTLQAAVAAGQLGGFAAPSAILPDAATQAARRAALPAPARLQADLAAAQSGLPFRADAFAPFLQDAAKARSAPLIAMDDLPPSLRLQLQTMLLPEGRGFVVMAPLHDVRDPQGLAARLHGAGFVDLNAQSSALLSRFQREAVTLAVSGGMAIALLLWAGLRSLRRALAVAAPLCAAVLISFALLSFGAAKISIFMVVGLLLIVAVGSNYCLFFELAEGNAALRQRRIASIVLANLCTVCAYGLMAFSRMPVLHDIGMTVALGTFLCLICAAILSPKGAV